ncbi:hypothetical protein MAR_035028 [Mya arenaria]|uniref:Helicase ATP-binding domain-containing protein n=1 Tax=Mya arenaria TaxID=6604 RepID=A0ABY7EIX6_MYAAR|nr:hypothetical protein MAR_035028 [Mya arenaria]
MKTVGGKSRLSYQAFRLAILEGKFEFLFSSPENLLGVSKWRYILVISPSIQLIVIDEAQLYNPTVIGANQKLKTFLFACGIGSFSNLATANKDARKKLQKLLCIKGCHELITNPDRANIKLKI